jgi:hypothetical protein
LIWQKSRDRPRYSSLTARRQHSEAPPHPPPSALRQAAPHAPHARASRTALPPTMLATDHTGTGASDAGAMPHSKRDRELDPSTPAAKRPMLLHAATAREEHSPATPADGRQESADGGGDGGDGGDGGAGGAGAVSDCTVSDTDKEDGQQQQQEDEEEELERDHDRGHDSDHDDRKDHEGRGQEDTSPRAARGGGLSDYSSAEQPVAAAAATAAQLEGSAEEMQVQALMQNFESIGVPSVRDSHARAISRCRVPWLDSD